MEVKYIKKIINIINFIKIRNQKKYQELIFLNIYDAMKDIDLEKKKEFINHASKFSKLDKS